MDQDFLDIQYVKLYDPFYTVTKYSKWIKTFWTDSTIYLRNSIIYLK